MISFQDPASGHAGGRAGEIELLVENVPDVHGVDANPMLVVHHILPLPGSGDEQRVSHLRLLSLADVEDSPGEPGAALNGSDFKAHAEGLDVALSYHLTGTIPDSVPPDKVLGLTGGGQEQKKE
jgi:hypothetical protein